MVPLSVGTVPLHGVVTLTPGRSEESATRGVGASSLWSCSGVQTCPAAQPRFVTTGTQHGDSPPSFSRGSPLHVWLPDPGPRDYSPGCLLLRSLLRLS